MALSPDLIQTIEVARAAMLDHATHELLPLYRRAIYRAFWSNSAPLSSRVRGYLALLSARHVLPIWVTVKPDDDIAEKTIKMGESVWQQRVDIEIAERQVDKAWSYLEQLAVTSFGDTNAFFAGFAAVKALTEVLGRDPFQDVIINEKSTDRDLDPWSGDTALYTAAAYSGPVWSSAFDISRRKAFWEWWLNTAIPKAWQASDVTSATA